MIEAMIATAIIGIGFTGVYSLVVYADITMRRSVDRQKLQMQANQILEIIESDLANITQYNAIDLTNCIQPDATATQKFVLRPYEWCQRLNAEVGSDTGSTRIITVTDLGDGRRAVHIQLEAFDGEVQVVMKRAYDD